MVNGGTAEGWSNMHYGHPRNLIAPGTAANMGDGWETARRVCNIMTTITRAVFN